jgi:hypothetical protein
MVQNTSRTSSAISSAHGHKIARKFQMRNSRLIQQGKVRLHEALLRKVVASEWQERLGQAALEVLGVGGLQAEDAGGATVRDTEQCCGVPSWA